MGLSAAPILIWSCGFATLYLGGRILKAAAKARTLNLRHGATFELLNCAGRPQSRDSPVAARYWAFSCISMPIDL